MVHFHENVLLFDINRSISTYFDLNNNPLNQICHYKTDQIPVTGRKFQLKSDNDSFMFNTETFFDLIAQVYPPTLNY